MTSRSSTSVSELTDLARTPANAMYLAYFTALENASGALGPFKTLTRVQAELVTLMSRRALAHCAVPAHLAACRSPFDVFQEQKRFWDTAAAQYAQSSRQMIEAWTAVATAPAVSQSLAKTSPNTHDYIDFSSAKRAKRPVEPLAYGVREFA